MIYIYIITFDSSIYIKIYDNNTYINIYIIYIYHIYIIYIYSSNPSFGIQPSTTLYQQGKNTHTEHGEYFDL